VFRKPVPQPLRAVIHWFQSMKPLSQASKMEARRRLFQVKEHIPSLQMAQWLSLQTSNLWVSPIQSL